MDQAVYNRRLDLLLTAMDLPEMRKLALEVGSLLPKSDVVLEVAMHKTRVERVAVNPQLRLESIKWLKERGYSRHRGLPWPPEGQLPE